MNSAEECLQSLGYDADQIVRIDAQCDDFEASATLKLGVVDTDRRSCGEGEPHCDERTGKLRTISLDWVRTEGSDFIEGSDSSAICGGDEHQRVSVIVDPPAGTLARLLGMRTKYGHFSCTGSGDGAMDCDFRCPSEDDECRWEEDWERCLEEEQSRCQMAKENLTCNAVATFE